MMTNAFIYCRSAVEDDAAIAAQESACRRYAEEHGITVLGAFHDNGLSGLRRSRPGLEALIKKLYTADAAKNVLVDELHRLARDIELLQEIDDQLDRAEATLIVALPQAA